MGHDGTGPNLLKASTGRVPAQGQGADSTYDSIVSERWQIRQSVRASERVPVGGMFAE